MEELTLFLLSSEEGIALRKRPATGLLAHLWEFPHVPGTLDLQQALQVVRDLGCEPVEVLSQREKGHIFTHVEWKMRAFDLKVRSLENEFVWVSQERLRDEFALPTAFRQFLIE